jgi:hydantoinase/carbamoylase family amidase
MLKYLQAFKEITSSAKGCTRIAYSALEDQAHDCAWELVRSVSGLIRHVDAAGNLFAVPEAARATGAPVVLVGSHLDTVIEGGWLDGTLGVAAGIHVLHAKATGGVAHPRVGLVVFRDEEGVRFGTGLFGSKVFAGLCTEADLGASDADSVCVRDVVPDPGGCVRYSPPVQPAAFLECHIEQGMRLTDCGARIGVVRSIVGIRRFVLRGTGEANHAGTTEMRRRVDALVPVAEVVAKLPTIVADLDGAVATCGRLLVEPGAPNIVPGRVTGVVELRAGDTATLDAAEGRLRDLVASVRPPVEGGRVATVAVEPLIAVDPVPTDQAVTDRLSTILASQDIRFELLPSMAGHDTQHAAKRCPAGMFFIPSIDGISHNPAENSTDADIELAGDVMAQWVTATLSRVTP